MRRGNETILHITGKRAIDRLFEDSQWFLFFEQQNTDVVLLHRLTGMIFGTELENSPRNVENNIERNIAAGCQAVAVVSLSERYLTQIRNKARGYGKIVRVFSFTPTGLHDLRRWIESLLPTGERP